MDPESPSHLARLWSAVDKRALIVTAACIAAWRMLEQIPVTDLNPAFIATRLELYSRPGFFAAIGANSIPLGAYSIGSVGIGPYVNALVIATVVGVISSRVHGMFGADEGRLRVTRWARAVALVLAMGQAYGWTVLVQSTGGLPALDWSSRLLVCVELTGGTAITMLLAGAIDEFGLGFGYGAFLLYAMGIVAHAFHRLADLIAANPSFEAASKALLIGSVWSVAACAACVAVVLASDRVADRQIPILVSGVFRPVQFTYAVLFLPVIAGNYYVNANVAGVNWFLANWAPLGPSAWLSAVYIGLECTLAVAFAMFVAVCDQTISQPEPAIGSTIRRLALIAGSCVAILAILEPIVAEVIERRIDMLIPLGGFSLLIVVLMTVVVIRAIEGRPLRLVSLVP